MDATNAFPGEHGAPLPVGEAFAALVRNETGHDPRDGAVLALSGGPDSTALLDLWLSVPGARERAVAAHLDHGIRPESPEDALFVAAQARDAGIAFVTRRVEVPALARPGAGGIEAVARRERLRFLHAVAADRGLPAVATAHHLDDQAETVLLRILRGAGTAGLAGIEPVRPIEPGAAVVLLRPLLTRTRADLVAHLSARGLPFLTDRTNEDGSNLRSRLRGLLLPLLAPAGPDLARRLATLSAGARALRQVWRSQPPSAARPALLREALRALSPGLDRRAIERLARILDAGEGSTELPGRIRVRCASGALSPGDEGDTGGPTECLLACPGEVRLGALVLRARRDDRAMPGGGPGREVIDAGAAPPPYLVRAVRPGDRFRPLGQSAETTVLRFLMGQGVPRTSRRETLVALSQGRVVWVVGRRIAEAARITPETGERVVLTADDGS